MNKLLVFLFITLLSLASSAQSQGPAMADPMRENGKIYVVIGVIAVIFVSIVVFLVFIERKLAKLERQLGTGKKSEENS